MDPLEIYDYLTVTRGRLLDGARPRRDANRSAQCLATIGMPRRARLQMFWSAIRTENFEIFSRPQNF